MTNVHGFQIAAGFQPAEQQEQTDQNINGLLDEIEYLTDEVLRLRDKVERYQEEQGKTVRTQLIMDALLVVVIGIAILTVVLFRI